MKGELGKPKFMKRLGGNAKHDSEVKMEVVTNHAIYSLPPGKIGYAGLDNVNFKETKFWSIATANNDKIIIYSGPIQVEKSIRIKISSDFSVTVLDQKDA